VAASSPTVERDPPPPIRTAASSPHSGSSNSDTQNEAENSQESRQQQLAKGLQRAHFGFMHYAMENGGRFPQSLNKLPLRHFEGTPPVILDPFSGTPMEVEYTAGLTTLDSADMVLFATPLLQNGKRMVVLVSGSIKVVDEQEFQKLVEDLPELERTEN
jgi:hypothetical protein